MTMALLANEDELQLAEPEFSALIQSVGIPARPTTLIHLQNEIAKENANLGCVASLVESDAALTVSVLRIVNSPAFGLSHHQDTISQSISILGLKPLNGIVTGLMLRNVLRGDRRPLTRYWDESSKRSYAMTRLARELGGVDLATSQLFGLFCDVGIVLLMQRFSDYRQTLQVCNTAAEHSFTELEQTRYQTDHAMFGALMARSWGMPPMLCQAIRLHHDYAIFEDLKVPQSVEQLIAMSLVADLAIQHYHSLHTSTEWQKGGEHAMGALVFNDQDVEDWVERLTEDFDRGLA